MIWRAPLWAGPFDGETLTAFEAPPCSIFIWRCLVGHLHHCPFNSELHRQLIGGAVAGLYIWNAERERYVHVPAAMVPA